jgi:enterochelin esterase-like enzyme
MRTIATLLLIFAGSAFAEGTLTPYMRISSVAMGYDIQYRVYLPEGIPAGERVPVMFVTDGPAYIHNGRVPGVLDRLIGAGSIEPVVVVFVDSRNPDDLHENRRNDEFFCNRYYLAFYIYDLIPVIEATFPVQQSRAGRSIMGLSFGGLNAACFGLLGFDTFSGIAMQSPATHPEENLLAAYANEPRRPLKIFLSTGTDRDNTTTNRRFRKILQDKGYELEYVQTNGGHNWDNWRPLIDDVFKYFYGTEAE